jgi:hypothetical protein
MRREDDWENEIARETEERKKTLAAGRQPPSPIISLRSPPIYSRLHHCCDLSVQPRIRERAISAQEAGVGVESGHHKMAREVPNDEEEHFQLGH